MDIFLIFLQKSVKNVNIRPAQGRRMTICPATDTLMTDKTLDL